MPKTKAQFTAAAKARKKSEKSEDSDDVESEEDDREEEEVIVECYPMIKSSTIEKQRDLKLGVPPQPTLKIICKACLNHPGVNDPNPFRVGAFDKHEYWFKGIKAQNECAASLPLHMLKDHKKHNKKWFKNAFGDDYLSMSEKDMASKSGWIDGRYDIWDWDFNGVRDDDWKEKREQAKEEEKQLRMKEAEKTIEENGRKIVDEQDYLGYQEYLKMLNEGKGGTNGEEEEIVEKTGEETNDEGQKDVGETTENGDGVGGENDEGEGGKKESGKRKSSGGDISGNLRKSGRIK